VTPDGNRFVVVADPSTTANVSRTLIRYVTNWTEELRERVK